MAEHASQIVGHIAFSPVIIEDSSSGWYGVAPGSVLPEIRGKGVGRALIEHGLDKLLELSAIGFVLFGDPAFYTRFGFSNTLTLSLDGVPK